MFLIFLMFFSHFHRNLILTTFGPLATALSTTLATFTCIVYSTSPKKVPYHKSISDFATLNSKCQISSLVNFGMIGPSFGCCPLLWGPLGGYLRLPTTYPISIPSMKKRSFQLETIGKIWYT